MTNSIVFLRLNSESDKQSAMENCLAALTTGDTSEGRLFIKPRNLFLELPLQALGYWVSTKVAEVFSVLDQFENDTSFAKQGLATADDFRFLRVWWEVPLGGILSTSRPEIYLNVETFQSSCVHKTNQASIWVPFSKGGEYSPFYADIHLVVNWWKNGIEIKEHIIRRYPYLNGKWEWVAKNTAFYFIRGLTWSLRTAKGITFRALSAGCIFGHKGPAAFAKDLDTHLGLMNSRPFKALLGMHMAVGSYEVGVINRNPVPEYMPKEMGVIAIQALEARRRIQLADEINHGFSIPQVLMWPTSKFGEVVLRWNEEISKTNALVASTQERLDFLAMRDYGFGEEDAPSLDVALSAQVFGATEDNEESVECDLTSTPSDISRKFLGYAFGACMGRWDVRISIDPSLAPKVPGPFDPLPVCPPGMLVNSNGLPAEAGSIVSEEWLRGRPDAITLPLIGTVSKTTTPDSEYPLRVSWDGVLVDDAGFGGGQSHTDDIPRRVREVIRLVCGEKAHELEQESCDAIGVSDLRDYFRNPAGFFQYHLKEYSKSRRRAPIYWRLSTSSGAYSVWLYYHRLTKDTFYKILNEYVNPKIAYEERDLTNLRQQAGSSPSAGQRKEIDGRTQFLDELRALRDEIAYVAPLWNPDLNDGVIINHAPLWRLVSHHRAWQRNLKECWDNLITGEYDWSHLAMNLWPERVVPKCADDLSLAIAHGLEMVFWEKDAKGKWKQRKVSGEEMKRLVAARSSSAVKASLNELLTASGSVENGKHTRKARAKSQSKGKP